MTWQAAFITLCLLASATAWIRPRMNLEYEVSERRMNGFYDIKPQYAGVEITYKANVFVESSSAIVIKLKHLQGVVVNDELDEDDWKQAELPDGQAFPQEVAADYEQPFKCIYKNGEFVQLQAPQSVPRRVQNFFKAQCSVWQLQLRNAQKSTGADEETAIHYRVREEALQGNCETQYQVTPMMQFVVKEDISGEIDQAAACHGEQRLEVLKSKNISDCDNNPGFHIRSPASMRCPPGANSCGHVLQHSTFAQYIGCGTPQSFVPIQILVTDHVKADLGMVSGDKAVAGAFLNYTLISQPTQLRNVPQVNSNDAQHINHLHYKWPGAKYVSASTPRIQPPGVHEPPLTPYGSILFDKNAMVNPPSTKSITDKLLSTIVSIAKQLRQPSNIIEKDTLSDVELAIELARQLDYKNLKAVKEQVFHLTGFPYPVKKAAMMIMCDVYALAGTNPSVRIVLDAIQQKELKQDKHQWGAWAPELISHAFAHMVTPTEEVLSQIFDFVRWTQTTQDVSINSTAMVNFANLLHTACVNQEMAHYRYPTTIYGRLCRQNAPIVQAYVQYLKEKLYDGLRKENTDKILASLLSMNRLGHPDVIKALIPIIRGDVCDDPYIRTEAVYALERIAMKAPPKVLQDLLPSVALDSGEHPDVRIAAITVLIYSPQASRSTLQQMATQSWFNQNRQVHCFLSTYIDQLTQAEDPAHALIRSKAISAKTMLKPVSCGPADSSAYVHSEHQYDMDLALYHEVLLTADRTSFLPSNIYTYAKVGAGATQYASAEMSVWLSSFRAAVEEIKSNAYVAPYAPTKKVFSPEIQAIKRSLSMEDRTIGDSIGSLYFAKSQDQIHFMPISEEWGDRLQDFVQDKIDQLLSEQGYWYNWVRVQASSQNIIGFPSELGDPFYIQFSSPSIFKNEGHLHGHTHPDIRGEKDHIVVPEKANVTGRADISYSWEVFGKIGSLISVNKLDASVSLQRNLMVNARGNIEVGVDTRKGAVTIAYSPVPDIDGVNLTVAHIQQIPATEVAAMVALEAPGEKATPVIVSDDMDEELIEVGMNSLGFKGELNATLDTPVSVHGLLVEYLADATPESLFLAPSLIPTARYGSVCLTLDMEQSPTRTVAISFVGKSKRVSQGKPESSEESSEEDSSASASSSNESGNSDSSTQTPLEQARERSNYYYPFANHQPYQYYYFPYYYDKADSDSQETTERYWHEHDLQPQSSEEDSSEERRQRRLYHSPSYTSSEAQLPRLFPSKSSKQEESSSSSSSSEETYTPRPGARSYEAQYPYGQQYYYPSYKFKEIESSTIPSSSSSSSSEESSTPGSVHRSSHIRAWRKITLVSNRAFQPNQSMIQESEEQAANSIKSGHVTTAYTKIVAVGERGQQKQKQIEFVTSFAADDYANKAGLYAEAHKKNYNNQQTFYASKKQPQQQQPKEQRLVVDLEGRFQPITYLQRKQILNADTLSKIQGTVTYEEEQGEKDQPTHVQIDMQMYRDRDQKQYAEESDEAQQCSQDEKDGYKLTENCQEAIVQAATLNRYKLQVQYNKPHTVLVNATVAARDMIIYALYPHLDNNPVDENQNVPQNGFHVEAKFLPDADAVHISVLQQKGTLKFTDVPVPEIVEPAILGHRMVKRALNQATDQQYAPQCVLDKDRVDTFDNVTYFYQMNDCYHVVFMNCTRMSNLTVLAKKVQGGRQFKIIAGPRQVKLVPNSQSSSDVFLDGQQISLPVGGVKEAHVRDSQGQQQLALVMQRYPDGAVKVKSHLFGFAVVTQGRYSKIYASNSFRNISCGMCGDFNGEQVAEFKGPRDCVLSQGEHLAASYALKDSSCQSLDQQLVQAVHKEQQQCVQQYPNVGSPSKQGKPHQKKFRQYLQDSDSQQSESSESCEPQQKTVHVQKTGKSCSSKRQWNVCPSGCQPADSQLKEVTFQCGGKTEKLQVRLPKKCEKISKNSNSNESQQSKNSQESESFETSHSHEKKWSQWQLIQQQKKNQKKLKQHQARPTKASTDYDSDSQSSSSSSEQSSERPYYRAKALYGYPYAYGKH